MRVQINETETYEFTFPETATVEEAMAIAEHIHERISHLTSINLLSRPKQKVDKRLPHSAGRRVTRKEFDNLGKEDKRTSKGAIKSRDRALKLFRIYYDKTIPNNEKVKLFILEGVKYGSFASNTSQTRRRWDISKKDIAQIKADIHSQTTPTTEGEVKKNEESLTSSVNKTADAKDFADEFEKW